MFRLPEGWGRPVRVDDLVLAAGLRIHRSGLAVKSPRGEEIFGAAADLARPATARAWFELVERICVVEASEASVRRRALYTADRDMAGTVEDPFPRSPSPRRWVPSRSNGVALHIEWSNACRRATWELAERDRVLRSWMGEIVPRPISIGAPFASTDDYEWVGCSFPLEEPSFSEGLEVAGVFAFPRRARLPMAMGFAARPDLPLAIAAATSEALQQLAFLWEAPRSKPSSSDVASPDIHLDTYQARASHSHLRAWLDGEHRPYARSTPRPRLARSQRPSPVQFVDLTGKWLNGRVCVAKAICDDAVRLEFGQTPRLRHLPPELRIHPIA